MSGPASAANALTQRTVAFVQPELDPLQAARVEAAKGLASKETLN